MVMAMLALHTTTREPSRPIGFAVTVVLHVLLIGALLSYAPARKALSSAAPIVVSLIAAPVLEEPVVPPKPLPPRAMNKLAPQQRIPVPEPLMTAPIAAALEPLAPEPAHSSPDVPPSPAPTAPVPIDPPSFTASYLDNPAPEYPPLARRSGEQGRVILRVHVTADGKADAVELRTSSGSQRLDQAAIETVKRWRFVPARQGSNAVTAWVLVPIAFSLAR